MILRRILLLFALSIGPATAGAAGGTLVDVQPTRLHLTAGRSCVLTVTNVGAEPVRFEIFAHGWRQADDGGIELVPTRDVAFYPSLLEIPPGTSRPIRVGVTARPRDREATYRLVVRQMPAAAQTTGTALRILTEMSIPIFVAPPGGARAVPGIEPGVVEDGKLRFRLFNTGDASYRAQRVEVRLLGDRGEELERRELPGWYVLARGTLRRELEIPQEHCPGLREVRIEVEIEGHEPIRARQPLRCTPP